MKKRPMKIIIEEWDGDGAIRIPYEALQELELDVGDAVYLIEEFVGKLSSKTNAATLDAAKAQIVAKLATLQSASFMN